jgi:FkbM family methyltransferase
VGRWAGSFWYRPAIPATRTKRRLTYLRVNVPWRRLFPERVVRRHVQGVDLYLPWSHPLPDYAKNGAGYGQNLVELARELGARGGGMPLRVLDVGANIGDSSLQIMAATDARVLCVEGDRYWANFLRKNLGHDERATIEEVLLVPEGTFADATPVRGGGTTSFRAEAPSADAMPTMTVNALRAAHPEFDRLRLIKSDTDGYDPGLVPVVAKAWSDAGPVLHFEFDPMLARAVGDDRPNDVWAKLANLGYKHLGLWDNGGDPLGRLDIAQAAEAAASLEPRPSHTLGYDFWDVAAVRADDEAGVAALEAIVSEPYSERGTWRNRAS